MKDNDGKIKMEDNNERCPHCNANRQGEPIHKDQQHLFNATHFSRKIGIYSLEKDITIHYQCPDCGGIIKR